MGKHNKAAHTNKLEALIRDTEKLKEVLTQTITVESLYIISLNN